MLLAAGFFDSPNIILVRQYNSDYTCPNTLYSAFDISFSNEGNSDTALCVNLNSPNENLTFIREKDCLYSNSGEQIPFKFKINDSSFSKTNNVTINYNYFYKKFFFVQNHTITFYYIRENYWQSLELKEEKVFN